MYGDSSTQLARVIERLGHTTLSDGNRSGIKPAQWAALRYFALANRFSATTTAFARYRQVSVGAASQTISMLVSRGLLIREPHAEDQRRFNLGVTSAARRVLSHDPLIALANAARQLRHKECCHTVGVLEQLLAQLTASPAGLEYGFCRDCEYLNCALARKKNAQRYHCTQLGQGLVKRDLDKICCNYSSQTAPRTKNFG